MKTSAQIEIEQINYDLILKLSNLTQQQKNILLGNTNKYIAVKKSSVGFEAFFETIGRRDDCANTLKQILNELQFA
ncbi:MAG: hypothetical protein EAY69_01035 [Cytophagales bacterium]|nr:MAG: hypothetical protein EAY69_01035 [Cytophagales bacterium]